MKSESPSSTSRRAAPMAMSGVLAAALGFAPAALAELEWVLAPYLWASDVVLDATINGDQNLGNDVSFSDLIDKVDLAFMGHGEVRGENWGAFADAIYITLSDETTRNISIGPGPGVDLDVEGDLTMEIYELGGFYRMGEVAPGSAEVDLMLGARTIDMDLDIDITLPAPPGAQIGPNSSQSETDVFAGVRVIGLFNDRWGYKLRADYGEGGTEGTLNLMGTIGYTFGDGLFTLDVGYRHFEVELANDSGAINTETDIEMSGPLVGFIFAF